MASLGGLLSLNADVLLVPVSELPEESRRQLDCQPDDVAVSRLQARSGSKIVDADAARLLERFRQPRTVAEAVILFGREKQLAPEEVLEGAIPLLESLVAGGFLRPAGEGEGPREHAPAEAAALRYGQEILGAVVDRTLQVLDDTEVHVLARAGGRHTVLKLERPVPWAPGAGGARARFDHEAAFLAHLGGALAPRLLGLGSVEGRAYLEQELVEGVDAAAAAAEWRERGGDEGRAALLELLQAIAATYGALHGRGALHGDVHPRNVLVGRDGAVLLIDFGLARGIGDGLLPASAGRGGIPFFFEPELARAYLAGAVPPPASEPGEQYAVGALLYLLATGAHWQDFRLSREAMLEDILARAPLSFRERGTEPWPELEAVLGRALAKEPSERFPSLRAFADHLAALRPRPAARPSHASLDPLARKLDEALAAADIDGPWMRQGLSPAPTCSLNYGSAGIALGLLHVAQRRGDSRLLALADLWARRAAQGMEREGAFHNPEIQITAEVVGESSPYHSPSGVHAVSALVARALAHPRAQAAEHAKFLEAAARPAAGLDLTLGRSSTLLAAAILLDACPAGGADEAALRSFGDAGLADLWRALDAKPEIAAADCDYPGMAHGWAGFLSASLQWCRVSGSGLPESVERRLSELAGLARPVGRGLEWPWVLPRAGEPASMAGWCNGSCGHVFVWTLAHRVFGQGRYLDHALGAAWSAWDSPEGTTTLCCGLAGRAYALLAVYRATGERVWLERARDLARRAARQGGPASDYPHALYKGELGLAVLAADLEQPEEAVMPFFEPLGYRQPLSEQGGATAHPLAHSG